MSEEKKQYYEGDVISADDINTILLSITNINSNINEINTKIKILEENTNPQEALVWGTF